MSAPSLRDVQQWMKARIQPPIAGSHATQENLLNPQRDTPGAARLAVYAQGYVARMRESLAEVFEAIHHVIGEQSFSELSSAYAAAHPSQDYNLSFAGRHLPAFLQTWPLATRWPFLADLAALEWMICQAFHAAAEPPLDPIRLAAMSAADPSTRATASGRGLAQDSAPQANRQVPRAMPVGLHWDRVRLRFQRSASCLVSAWPVLDIWDARQRPRKEINIELINRPQHVLVCRAGLTVRCELLSAGQYQVLRALLDGQPLGAACQSMSGTALESAAAVQAWFAHWMQLGLIVG